MILRIRTLLVVHGTNLICGSFPGTDTRMMLGKRAFFLFRLLSGFVLRGGCLDILDGKWYGIVPAFLAPLIISWYAEKERIGRRLF